MARYPMIRRNQGAIPQRPTTSPTALMQADNVQQPQLPQSGSTQRAGTQHTAQQGNQHYQPGSLWYTNQQEPDTRKQHTQQQVVKPALPVMYGASNPQLTGSQANTATEARTQNNSGFGQSASGLAAAEQTTNPAQANDNPGVGYVPVYGVDGLPKDAEHTWTAGNTPDWARDISNVQQIGWARDPRGEYTDYTGNNHGGDTSILDKLPLPPEFDRTALDNMNAAVRAQTARDRGLMLQRISQQGARAGMSADQMLGAQADTTNQFGLKQAELTAQNEVQVYMQHYQATYQAWRDRYNTLMQVYQNAHDDATRKRAFEYAQEAAKQATEAQKALMRYSSELNQPGALDYLGAGIGGGLDILTGLSVLGVL